MSWCFLRWHVDIELSQESVQFDFAFTFGMEKQGYIQYLQVLTVVPECGIKFREVGLPSKRGLEVHCSVRVLLAVFQALHLALKFQYIIACTFI